MEDTHFAAPERAGQTKLEQELALVSSSAVVDGLLSTVGGLLVVLNSKRQVIAVNDAFLRQLGIENVKEIFGLRLGEVIGCVHAGEELAGCGTTRHCLSCGAAIAMVSSLATNEPVEQMCAVEVYHGDLKWDLYMQVRAVPFACGQERFLLIFLRDVTREQQWASEERVFFHDLKNVLCGLQGAADMITMGSPDLARSGSRILGKLVRRLSSEIELQKTLSLSEDHIYCPILEEVSVPGILLDIQEEFSAHPAALNKTFSITAINDPWSLHTDSCVLFRVLGNMVINALEATDPGGEVYIGAEMMGESMLRFTVWNRQLIPENVQLRIFQRNFTTKGQEGRGLGTWSMKFFGEKFLGGQVGFTSSEPDGTLFFLVLPLCLTECNDSGYAP